jgi:hypothetical protein
MRSLRNQVGALLDERTSALAERPVGQSAANQLSIKLSGKSTRAVCTFELMT